MRETITVDGGCVTPEMQAEYLSLYGHFIGKVGNEKYYTAFNSGYRVIFVDGKAVQVIKMTPVDAETMVSCSSLKFGKF